MFILLFSSDNQDLLQALLSHTSNCICLRFMSEIQGKYEHDKDAL